MKKLVVLFIIILSIGAIAQDQSGLKWWNSTSTDYWLLKQAGYTINTWDSVTTSAVWSEPFRPWNYMSACLHMVKDSVRVYVEYWAGLDTARASMVFGRTLEWDNAVNLDSTYLSSTGYWNSNITASPIPVHPWARLKITPGATGSRVIKDDSLFTIYITGRK